MGCAPDVPLQRLQPFLGLIYERGVKSEVGVVHLPSEEQVWRLHDGDECHHQNVVTARAFKLAHGSVQRDHTTMRRTYLSGPAQLAGGSLAGNVSRSASSTGSSGSGGGSGGGCGSGSGWGPFMPRAVGRRACVPTCRRRAPA
jgi:hypothetical protein